jgi:hypothetical protein
MAESDEQRSIESVVSEISHRFPDVPRVVIEQFVTKGFRQFDGAPVREYIPVMVKRTVSASITIMIAESRRVHDHHRRQHRVDF